RNEQIVGVVDWEFARPAPPMRDLAYAVWMTVPLRTDEDAHRMRFDHTPHARERLKAFLAGYGFSDRSALLQSVLPLHLEYRDKIERFGVAGKEPWKTFRDMKLQERNRRDCAWLQANLDMLLRDP